MLLSIRHEILSPDEVFSDSAYRSTFVSGLCQPCRLHGPGTLVRLVDSSRYSVMNSSAGDYWREECVFRGFLQQARADLMSQGVTASPHLVGLHARFQLRDGFAVSRDWSNIDHFIQMDLPAGTSVVALVGPATSQTYYSSKQPVDQARAAAAGISLPGSLNQIIINFDFPANEPAKSLIRGPYPF